MPEVGLGPTALRILRPIVFAGAVESAELLVCCQGPDLANHIRTLSEGGYIEDIGLLVPTEKGNMALDDWYAADRANMPDAERDAIVARFRPLDIEVKRLSIAWQDAEQADDWDARMGVIEALSALQEKTQAFVSAHGERLPRWREFGDRLAAALDALLDGETDYVVSVRLPSYHTIWFEFHEDLLRTLERQRDKE